MQRYTRRACLLRTDAVRSSNLARFLSPTHTHTTNHTTRRTTVCCPSVRPSVHPSVASIASDVGGEEGEERKEGRKGKRGWNTISHTDRARRNSMFARSLSFSVTHSILLCLLRNRSFVLPVSPNPIPPHLISFVLADPSQRPVYPHARNA